MTEDQFLGSPSEPASSDKRPSRLREAASLTKWLKVLMCCWMGTKLVACASHWALLKFFENVAQGVYLSRSAAIQDATMLDRIGLLVRVGDLALFFLTAILFLKWVYRANENARRLGAVDMQFTPRWAIGCYFVPIANLVLPYQAMKEIWNASTNPAAWRSLRGHQIVRWWWGLYLAWNLFGYVALINSSTAKGGIAGSILSTRIFLVLDASAIFAAIGALLLITRLRAMQVAHGSLVATVFE